MSNLKHKIKHIFLLVVMLLMARGAMAQQLPIFTQYHNSYAFANPAFFGMSEGINLMGLYRQQWAGFTDADGNSVSPQSFLFSGDVPLRVLHGGLGLSVLQDHIGAENDVNIGLGYSYHMDLGGSVLGIGLSGTLINRSVDFSQLHPISEGDPLLVGLGDESAVLFDFNVGVFWQIPESVYVGFSVVNVLESMTKALNDNAESSASFVTDRTFYLMAGYPFQFEGLPNFKFVPSVNVMTDISAWQLNASMKVIYKDLFSLGLNYRPQESVGIMVGLTIKDITVGYAYDINTMGLNVPGSHEIALSYCFKLDLDRNPRDYRSVRYL